MPSRGVDVTVSRVDVVISDAISYDIEAVSDAFEAPGALFGGADCAVGNVAACSDVAVGKVVWLPRALLRVELPPLRQVPPLLPCVEVFCIC